MQNSIGVHIVCERHTVPVLRSAFRDVCKISASSSLQEITASVITLADMYSAASFICMFAEHFLCYCDKFVLSPFFVSYTDMPWLSSHTTATVQADGPHVQ
jgi:hypothetical protein